MSVILAPLGWLYRAVVDLRRFAYGIGYLPRLQLPVPVVVVGNITVGGTGKTPVVIAIAQLLVKQGYRPGIAVRGYRGKATAWPQEVTPESDPRQVGDEAVLLAQRTACAVAAGPDRVLTAQRLVEIGCNVVLCDDGLQHYRLARDIEVAVVDGERRHGNGRCLPAGPLREPPGRLRGVDLVVANGTVAAGEWLVRMRQASPTSVVTPSVTRPWSDFVATEVHAIAGIAYPQRFFADLEAKGLIVRAHAFADHHDFSAVDVQFNDDLPVFMTEKDAVKCRSYADAKYWCVPLTAELSDAFIGRLLELLKGVHRG